MFGAFGEPLPQGKYVIRESTGLALHLRNIFNNTLVSMADYEEHLEYQMVCVI